MSHPPAPGAVPVPGSATTPQTPSAPASTTDNKIRFFGSQVGGEAVINYGYTDMPFKLLVWDIRNFFVYIWFLPWIVWPLTPTDSNDFDELALNRANVWCIFVHVILVVLQLVFILALPFSLLFPLWLDALAITLFFTLNWAICMLLNGKTKTLLSDPKYATEEDHPNEQWIFLNGVAAGEAWLTSNINRLALTFRRPVIGIHNRTSGILFDVVECLIQRNFGYATGDVREAYKVVKDKLYNPQYSKVVFILHSQGGIEGGLVLDWLLQEMPQDLLAKLEVYTFGNAANHFNNPHLHVEAQKTQREHCAAASAMRHHGEATMPMMDSPVEYKPSASPVARHGDLSITSHHDRHNNNNSTAAATHPAHVIPTTSDRVLAHVEHYAHTTDFVALWGVLHFATSQMANKQLPRFIGRVFARTSPRGGHQFCQHYLDGMFPLEKNPRWEEGGEGEAGVEEFLGCADSNEFMDSIVEDGAPDAGSPDAVAAAATTNIGNVPAGAAVETPSRPTVTTTSPNDTNGAAPQPQPSSNQAFTDIREDIATSLALLLPNPSAILEAASLPFSSDKDADAEEVQFHGGSKTASDVINRKLRGGEPVRVKDLSRLWLYRNGRSPPDVHREGDVGGGVIRGKTM